MHTCMHTQTKLKIVSLEQTLPGILETFKKERLYWASQTNVIRLIIHNVL